jgi:hypothetical protein
VWRNWRHSLATLLAITTGFTAVSLFDGFISGVGDRVHDGYVDRAMLGHIVVYREGATEHSDEDPWKYAITLEEQKFLDAYLTKDPDFALRVRHLTVSGMASNGRNSAVFIGLGHDILEGAKNRGETWGWNAVAGKPLYQAPEGSVLLAQGLASLLGCESQYHGNYIRKGGGFTSEERPFTCYRNLIQLSATTEHAQINAVEANVAGLMDAGMRDADLRLISMPLPLVQALLDTDKITLMAIRLKDEAQTPAFIKRLKRASESAGFHFEIMPWSEHPNAVHFKNVVQILFVFRNMFTSVLIIIAGLSIANTMMKSVNERIREIGMLKSVGFRTRDLAWMFGCEGFFLAFIACTAGWLITSVSSWAITAAGITYRAGILSIPIPLEINQAPFPWLITTLILLALATFTAWFTARRSASLTAAEALRSV